jgi:hypothetical protein
MTTEFERAGQWIGGHDTGVSSKAIYSHMISGGKVDVAAGSYPGDPSDMGRCLRLLRLLPEWNARIVEMARHGPYWAALVARWDEISKCMEAEVGLDWEKSRSAKKTYELMKSILDPIEAADPTVIILGKGVKMRTRA